IRRSSGMREGCQGCGGSRRLEELSGLARLLYLVQRTDLDHPHTEHVAPMRLEDAKVRTQGELPEEIDHGHALIDGEARALEHAGWRQIAGLQDRRLLVARLTVDEGHRPNAQRQSDHRHQFRAPRRHGMSLLRFAHTSFTAPVSTQPPSTPPGSIWPTSSPTSLSMSAFSLAFIASRRSRCLVRSSARFLTSSGSVCTSNNSTSFSLTSVSSESGRLCCLGEKYRTSLYRPSKTPRIAPRFVRSGRIAPAFTASVSAALPSGWSRTRTAFSRNSPSMYANML